MSANVYQMRTYFDESVNMGLAMSALSIAIIGFADKFIYKASLQVMGVVMLVAALCIPTIYSLDFLYFIRGLRDDEVPSFMSKNRHYIYLACVYVYIIVMIIVSILLILRRVAPSKK